VIVKCDHPRRIAGISGSDQRLGRGMTRCQVVEARRVDELPIGSRKDALRHVVKAQVPSQDLVGRNTETLAHERGELRLLIQWIERENGQHLRLRIERETTRIHLSIEMDGEVGDATQRLVDAQQATRTATQAHASSQRQIAIEPGGQEHTTIDLDGELMGSLRAKIGLGLHAQIRRVRVRANQQESRVRGRLLTGHERDHATAALHHVAA
jgi:hypothetical protein